MKTVIDAVNELECDLENSHGYNVSECEFIFHDCSSTFNNWIAFKSKGDVTNIHYDYICTRNQFNQCIDDMISAEWMAKPLPVYTKSMQDAGELPSVGMVFIDTENWHNERICLFIHGQNVIYFDGGRYKSAILSECKPIDTRSDSEKAIDEACAIIDDSQRCLNTNVNIDCSAAQKAVIITMIERGYVKKK